MQIQGYTLRSPLSSSITYQAFVARDRHNSPVRLTRFLEVKSEALQRRLEFRRVRLQRCGLIEHPNVCPWILVEKSDDEIIVVSPSRQVYVQSTDRTDHGSAMCVVANLAKALAEAHRYGVPHCCLTLATLYWSQDARSLSIDLIDSLLTDDLEWLLEQDARMFAGDVRDLGRIIPTLLEQFDSKPEDAERLKPWVNEMIQEDWLNRPTMDMVRDFAESCLKEKLNAPVLFEGYQVDEATAELPAFQAMSMVKENLKYGNPSQLGRFSIERSLGEGGMGAVFLGRDLSNDQVVAIKVLAERVTHDEKASRRFEKEARLLSTISHPSIARLIEFNRDAGAMYLAMEFVPGGCLADFTRTNKPVEERLAVAAIADAARGLAVAHQNGMVHRDVKPANLLLTARGERSFQLGIIDDLTSEPLLKVADFGLAKHFDVEQSMAMTQTGMIMGTPLYMAPEQCRGELVGPQADVYALGVTLFQCLAGRVPFDGKTPVEIFRNHCDSPVPQLRSIRGGISDAVQNVVAKCLEKKPLARYRDAGELLCDLDGLLLGEPTSIQLHPEIPGMEMPGRLRYQYSWRLRSSPESLWPYLANTDRVNHAIGLPAVHYKTIQDPNLGMRRMATVRAMGMNMEWEEHPYEWIEGRRLSVLRQFPSGPFHWFANIVELKPQSDGGTLVVQTLQMLPRNLLGKWFAKIQIGSKSERNFGRVYEKIDAYLQSNLLSSASVNPFSISKPMAREQKRRLKERFARVRSAAEGIEPHILDCLEQYLEYASDLDVARLRPMAFAERFGLDSSQTVRVCLLAAREGVMVLLWDILCPTCRIPSDVQETLKGLADHGHCESCNVDYELDFAQSIELIFRVHPEIRSSETRTYCVGGPAFSSHVVLQVRLKSDERLTEPLSLGDGQYRLRGAQLPYVIDFRVSASGRVSRWEIDLARPPSRIDIPILRTGDQVLALFNSCATPRQIRIERLASRADALTAADAARLPSFREWFPDEVLSPGQMVSLTTVTLMASQVANANQLYAMLPDQAACSQVLKHLQAMASIITSNSGCVIKSMNDGLNAVFPSVSNALSAAREITMGSADWGVSTKHAIHQGPALVATINDRLDYFGQTPLFVQELLSRCRSNETWMSDETWNDTPLADLLGSDWTFQMRGPLENWSKWNIIVARYNGAESDPEA